MTDSKEIVQLIWGIALFVMGVAFFFRIPDVIAKLVAAKEFASTPYFIEGIFYVISILLIIGGGRKIYAFWRIYTGNGPTDPSADGKD